MESFEKAYKQLNDAQKKAVDTIYGPILVIAGPGTGKTQLLSARVANILKKTDADAKNILCLTFTESGALAMRERLISFIGQSAYDVSISTYHGFGSGLIGRFPEYFTKIRLEKPIDKLGKYEVLKQIVDELNYDSPLMYLRYRLGDLIETISEVKRGLLTPDSLRSIADDTIRTIAGSESALVEAMSFAVPRMPRKLDVALAGFSDVLSVIKHVDSGRTNPRFPSLAELAEKALEEALETASDKNSTKPLTAWKNQWLEKNDKNEFRLKGRLEALRARALASVLESYDLALKSAGLYDFDDMILEAIDALEKNDDLRFSLHEQYQYILLDEFQDTNAAQLKLVELLTNNPVHEGRPNVLAVGDDDQAIYAFQGAEVSNMLDFTKMYDGVEVLPLTENYRSTAPILKTAEAIADQITSRLESHFENVNKNIVVASNSPVKSRQTTIKRVESASDLAERIAVADQIKLLVDNGVSPSEIAVLSTKHKLLESLVPYLQAKNLPVAYEKREDILKNPRVVELITMARLVLATKDNQISLADSLWPAVLSFDFWEFSVADIWQVSWQASRERKSWTELLLGSAQFNHAALLILSLAGKVETESAETIIDALIGSTDIATHDRKIPSVRSPFRDYYFKLNDQTLYETATSITVLRARYREYSSRDNSQIMLAGLINFVDAHETAGQRMLNTSPYNQADSAVQLMTVHRAKGLEFEHVFLLDVIDSVWGNSATNNSNKLTLPAPLASIRHAGASEDERLRELFVAITRAKQGLHLMSYRANFAGKESLALKYLDESSDEKDRVSKLLPAPYDKIETDDSKSIDLSVLELDWQTKHLAQTSNLKSLLNERLDSYQLSPTHLTNYIDLEYGGPSSWLVDTLLQFPGAPSTDAELGNAVHETMQWLQEKLNATKTLPKASAAIVRGIERITASTLTHQQKTSVAKNYTAMTERYLSEKLNGLRFGNIAEKNFRAEGVMIDGVHMSGKIDLLEINQSDKTIVVVDYKTGKAHDSWQGNDTSLHKYRLQLYCYKLLVENSKTYRGYTVKSGRLEFTRPNSDGQIISLEINFSDEETKRTKQLIKAVWQSMKSLELPDTSDFKPTVAEMKRFENQLIDGSNL